MERTTTNRESQQQQQQLVSRRVVIQRTHDEVNGKILRKLQVTDYLRNGRLVRRLYGDIKVLQLHQDGRTKEHGDPIFYYRRGINVLEDRQSTTILSRHQVKKGDVVEIILPKRLYDTDNYSQKKIYGVIDYIDVDNQNQLDGDREIGLIIKIHKDHKNTMKDGNGNTRSLNQEWVCVNLSNIKFIKRNAILGEDYIGSLNDSDEYYQSLGYTVLPPHPLHLFLEEWGNIGHFLKKN
jgi:hypothetical protein